jgi:hypothetical protein
MTSGLPHKNAKGVIESYKKYRTLTENSLNLVVIGIEDTEAYNTFNDVKKHSTCCKYIKDTRDMYNCR